MDQSVIAELQRRAREARHLAFKSKAPAKRRELLDLARLLEQIVEARTARVQCAAQPAAPPLRAGILYRRAPHG